MDKSAINEDGFGSKTEKSFAQSKSKTIRVFVYGTLKRGCDNHRILLVNSKFVSNAKTLHPYPMVCKYPSLPYLIDAEGEGFCMYGEVYDVGYRTMLRLDELKGYPDHYTRREIEVVLDDGSIAKATSYFLADKIQYDKYPFLERFEMHEGYVEQEGLESMNWCQRLFYLKGYNGRE